MANLTPNIRNCKHGHRYLKSSDCPVCPICEAAKAPPGDLPKLAAPARRALESIGVSSLAQLAKYTEAEMASLHGMGPNALNTLKESLAINGLCFSNSL